MYSVNIHTCIPEVPPYGRREAWQNSPEGWPQAETFDGWLSSQQVAQYYGSQTPVH
ncbi:hypothetical protein K0817_006150 [Microbacterium sp. HD4P20]|uniref:hypothetical protein n=1 Tax=Microbacterium sp. HD4P20 TaxID=2864874 RepID=UPI001C63E304|nr:hypothetical protein [Microbacterium sp. HD4P20]MCP2636150.1 hypothetical protein [Microbacterium sp. HD4P20]